MGGSSVPHKPGWRDHVGTAFLMLFVLLLVSIPVAAVLGHGLKLVVIASGFAFTCAAVMMLWSVLHDTIAERKRKGKLDG